MGTAQRFRYIVVASTEAGGEAVAAGAISPRAIDALIADFRKRGLSRIQIIETAAPPVPSERPNLFGLAPPATP